MKKILKRLGRFFIRLERQEGSMIGFNVLLIDSGYAAFGHLFSAINNIKKSLGNVKITLLISSQRLEFMKDSVQGLEVIEAGRSYIPKRFRIPFELIMQSRKRFDFVILLAEEFLPLMISILLLRRRLYLYNKQHKWCLLRRKTLNEYLGFIPRLIINIIIFIYLLFYNIFIFLKRTMIIKRRNIV